MIAVDSNIIIAALQQLHPEHARCFKLLTEGEKVACSQHALAECYAVLTTIPGPERLSPRDALVALTAVKVGTLQVVPLTVDDYESAIARLAGLSIPGARIYDLLHLIAAERAGADAFVTLNIKHFRDFAATCQIAIRQP